MLYEFCGLVDESGMSMGSRRKRQNDPVHEKINKGSIDKPIDDRMPQQKIKSSTRQIKNGGRTQGDYKMQKHTQDRAAHTFFVRLNSEEAARNGLRHEDRPVRAVDYDGVDEVEDTDDATANKYRRKRSVPASTGQDFHFSFQFTAIVIFNHPCRSAATAGRFQRFEEPERVENGSLGIWNWMLPGEIRR